LSNRESSQERRETPTPGRVCRIEGRGKVKVEKPVFLPALVGKKNKKGTHSDEKALRFLLGGRSTEEKKKDTDVEGVV